MTRTARPPFHILVTMLMLATLPFGGCGWVEVPGSGTGYTRGGQTASNPAVASADVVPRPPAAPTATARTFRAVPGGGKAVQAAPGDTVHSLSRRHGVSVEQIIETNRLQPPYHLVVGQWVTLTGAYAAAPPGREIESAALPPIAGSATPAAPATPVDGSAASVPVAEPPAPKPMVARAPAPVPAIPPPPELRSGGFIWPVDGKVVSSFGRKTKGLHNDGINIEVPRGTPVRAAQSGVVAYAGNELRGFGNMLLIKHSGGWVTAYAHNQTLKVGRGDQVTKGQIIAEVGTSGSVTTPQLHFELRKGKKPVDPLKYLGKGAV